MPKVHHYQSTAEAFGTAAAGGEVIPVDKWGEAGVRKTRKHRRFANPGRDAYVITYVSAVWWSDKAEAWFVPARETVWLVTARGKNWDVTVRETTWAVQK